MSTLYLLQYNNYFNRTIKRESSISNYITGRTYRKIDDINFFYNDNVNTVQTINYTAPIATPETQFDYLLVDNNIYGLSRWFIIENKWNRKGQQILTLRRDLVVDFLDTYITQPLFVEKGNIPTASSTTMPILSQSENAIVSQILQGTSQIYDGYGEKEWLVMYLDKSYRGGLLVDDPDAIYINDWSELETYQYNNTPLFTNQVVQARCAIQKYDTGGTGTTSVNNYIIPKSGAITISTFTGSSPLWCEEQNNANAFGTQLQTDLQTVMADYEASVELKKQSEIISLLTNYPNIVINGEAYHWVRNVNNTNVFVEAESGVWSQRVCNVATAMSGKVISGVTVTVHNTHSGPDYSDVANACKLGVYGTYQVWVLEKRNTTWLNSHAINMPATDQSLGVPYGILFCEYTPADVRIASIIASRLYSGGVLYDIQRLPYRPSSASGATPVALNSISASWFWANSTDRTYTASGSDIQNSYGTKSYSGSMDYKLGAACDLIRICSPNGANSWDFNPAMNGGVTSYKIRCTFKPFNPYIHVKPVFKWGYGNDYDGDRRGLICGGSFSLPLVNDKWASYQLNNKAYYDSFNRDIENLTTVQDAQRINEKWQIFAGAIAGAGYGYATGSNVSGGNPIGGAVGAVAGAAASLAGGFADYQMNEKLRDEAKDYRIDQFGFNSQNMIASPKTLARTDAFDIDYYSHVYVEFYSCSSAEKEALRDKIVYNGMSINYISNTDNTVMFNQGVKYCLNYANTPSDIGNTHYYVRYIKGKLIWTTNYDDTHIFNELANEFYKGFYWYGGTIT